MPEWNPAQERLLSELDEKVRRDLPAIDRVKGEHSTPQALRTVFRFRETIGRISAQYAVPPAYLETVLFREQRTVDLADAVADCLVQPFGLRDDSSTGLMQIKSGTAVSAIRRAADTGLLRPSDLGFAGDAPFSDAEGFRMAVWRRLNAEPEFNLTVAALVLLACAEEAVGHTDFSRFSDEDTIHTFARYNGHGDDALRYGQACCNWCRSFRAYEDGAHA